VNETEQLARHAPFSEMDDATLTALMAAGTLEPLPAGSSIEAPQVKDHLFILVHGVVELHGRNGERLRRGPGQILGLDSYLEQEYAHAQRVVAIRPGQTLRIAFKRMRELEKIHPLLSNAFNHIIAERIRNRGLMADGGTTTGTLSQPVSRVMHAPMATCPDDWTLRQALEAMLERKIGALGVTVDDGSLQGVATLASLAESSLIGGHGPDSPVRTACRGVECVNKDTPLWQAEAIQKRKGVKYLVVLEDDRPVGIVSQTNILQSLLVQQDTMLEWITGSSTLEQLHAIYGEVVAVAREAWQRNRDANRAVLLLSDFHLALQRRCVELTLEHLRNTGQGEAPRHYALIIMGSGGRREMVINPDQDNGIIIDDDNGRPLDEAEQRWFAVFTDSLNRNLDTVGYILCPGNIMARNPEYHMTLDGWCRRISSHTEKPTREAARWANIALDFDLLYGDAGLYSALWSHTLEAIDRRPRLLRLMTEDDALSRPALGFFGRLITIGSRGKGNRKGRVDIKRQGLRLICDASRIFALRAGISDSNTIERLRGLVRQGVISADLADSVIAAHEEFMDLLLSHQVRQMERGETPDKQIDPDSLTPLGRESLRMAMHAVKRFQEKLHSRFKPQ